MREMTSPVFTIKYRFHWCGPCEQYGDTKEETIIQSDGKIAVREYDHHGPNGHYRIVNRAEGSADIDTIQKLYHDLLDLISCRIDFPQMIMDAEAEIVLKEPGLTISADASITDGKNDGSKLINEFMKHINLTWEKDLSE